MRRVLIDTQNYLFGDAIAAALQRAETDFEVMKAEKPDQTAEISSWYAPYALLMEVTGCHPWRLADRLRIRDEVKKFCPYCKVVLIVDENSDKELAQQVRQAKKDGLIDNFIYGSISANYLIAIVDAL